MSKLYVLALLCAFALSCGVAALATSLAPVNEVGFFAVLFVSMSIFATARAIARKVESRAT